MRGLARIALAGALGAAAGCKKDDPAEEPARPGELRIVLADAANGEIGDAWLDLAEVAPVRCDDRPPRVTAVGGPWSVTPATALQVTGGTWCGLDVVPEGPLELWATAGDATLTATLAAPTWSLAFDPELRVDGDALVLLLGTDGWLDLADLDGDVVIDASSPAHAALAAALVPAELYPDDDRDGAVSDDERRDPLTSGG